MAAQDSFSPKPLSIPPFTFGHMQQEKIAKVMNGVGQGPSPGRAQPGIDEEQKMENNGDDDVSGPRSCNQGPTNGRKVKS